MLSSRHRMRRSADFTTTVKGGLRAAQPDIVIHTRFVDDATGSEEPLVGLIVGKSVGSSVLRHRVARRLRHVARDVLGDLAPAQRLVIRALPGSAEAPSATLRRQLRAGLRAARRSAGGRR